MILRPALPVSIGITDQHRAVIPPISQVFSEKMQPTANARLKMA